MDMRIPPLNIKILLEPSEVQSLSSEIGRTLGFVGDIATSRGFAFRPSPSSPRPRSGAAVLDEDRHAHVNNTTPQTFPADKPISGLGFRVQGLGSSREQNTFLFVRLSFDGGLQCRLARDFHPEEKPRRQAAACTLC